MYLTINGIQYPFEQDESILDFAHRQSIHIPTLCGKNKRSDKVDCNLCWVEIEGVGTRHACKIKIVPNMVVTTISDELAARRKKALDYILRDHYADCEAPCKVACPAGVDIQSYLYYISQNEHQKAVEVIKKTLPLPLSIGRVCPAFCEEVCRRGAVDEPVAIRQLKRHAADVDLFTNNPYIPEKKADKNKKVAIIGSGPGGLACGYYLSNEGFEVDVFEQMPKAGGWLQYGIPEYRLPKDILDKEIDLLCRNGMKIHTSKKMGKDFLFSELTAEYDAICLAIGASKAKPIQYSGYDLEGCYLGVDYLKDYMTQKTYKTGKKVAIIGGGNTAIDCARTAVRTGAETTLIYRRTRDDMPAAEYEIAEAEHEGVHFLYLTNPAENISDELGRVKSVRLEKMELGEPDQSGRRSPVATGEFFIQEFDTVISAVSQATDLSFLEKDAVNLSLNKYNEADVDVKTMQDLNVEGVFSIGDFRRGPATAIEAIADAKIAADAIERYIIDGKATQERPQFNSMKEKKLSALDSEQFAYIQKARRQVMPELSQEARALSFSEVEVGYDENSDAMKEAARCLECGCQANTGCDLRDYATEYEVSSDEYFSNNQYIDDQRQKFLIDRTSEFIEFDANRCMSCGQCVDACQHDVAHCVLEFSQPQGNTIVSQPERRPHFSHQSMADSNCVQCGSCIQVCPTGAMVDKRDRAQGRLDPLKQVKTICTYCGVGCRVVAHIDEKDNQIKFIEGDPDSPVNQGMLCVKGRFGFDFIQSKQRLDTPLIRKNNELVPATWDETISYIADRFKAIKAESGGDSLAGFSSAKTTNEDNYVFQKFIRCAFETNNVDHCARLCHSSTVTGLEASLGSGAMTNDIPSIHHSDLIFIIGSDTTAAHPIIASHIKQAVQNGARLIVADPKKIEIADVAMLYVAQRPGTDVMLLNGIMQQIILNDWQDDDFITSRIDGYAELKAEVLSDAYSPENVALVTGVSAKDVCQMAELIGTAEKTAVYFAMGITQHTTGHDNVRSVANLQMLCGNVGIEGAGINPLRGQSNVQGACDMGALPTDYPGYQKVEDSANHQKFSKHWNAPNLSPKKGLTLTEIIDGACHKKIRGLYIMGENPVLSDPDQAHVLKGLESLDFLVVQDIFLTETTDYADVVLPAYSFAEKTGHFTNTERRVQRLTEALNPPGQAKDDWWIIQQLANAMGLDWNYQTCADITEEITEVTPQYGEMHWERIGLDGLQWPCNKQNPNGTRLMHKETFIRGKGEMVAVPFRYAAELPDEDYPLILTTGRLLEQFHTGTMTRKTKGLDNLAGPRAMLSVSDAEKLGIENSERVKVSTRRGSIEIEAFVTKRMQAGVVFIPFHFVESAANKLTNCATDDTAKIPEFKVAALKIEKLHQLSQ